MSLTPEWVRNQLLILLREPVHSANCTCDKAYAYDVECIMLHTRLGDMAAKIVEMAKQCS